MPKGREIETYYEPDLKDALQSLKSDLSLLSDLQPFVAFYIDNDDMNDFINGTHFGHIIQQTFYVYVYRMMMVICKVLDPSLRDSWGFTGCYQRLGPGTQLLRELAYLRARHAVGVHDVTPPGDPELTRWMRQLSMKEARVGFRSAFDTAVVVGVEFDRIVEMESYKRIRVFRSEKIAHALIGSNDRRKYSVSAPVENPQVKCVLEVADAVIDFGERFFGHLTSVWPSFRNRQKVTKEYYNAYFKQLQFSGQMKIDWTDDVG